MAVCAGGLGEDGLMQLLDGIEAVISGPLPDSNDLARLEAMLAHTTATHDCVAYGT